VVLVSSGLGRAFGDPVYHPIYEAAMEMDLTLGLHIGGEIFYPGTAQVVAGGPPNTRLERHSLHMQPSHRHLMSFITHGVFEKFPNLRMIIKETGLGLYPWLLWEMDGVYDELQIESSWVRRRPSEYFFENVWVSTQPLDESPRPQQLIDALSTIDGFADRLCFSTDYPHHDADEPVHDDRLLPEEWWERVYFDNPAAAYGWTGLVHNVPAASVAAGAK
jgi:predicted TIM-barrel fold metal-dependent hydrolase